MALPSSTSLDARQREDILLRRLLNLYEEEAQIYHRILELSRQQGSLIRQGLPLSQIRKVLEMKKKCLETISRLEATERGAKQEWDHGRQQWSARGRSRLHDALGRVGGLIEQILVCEEDNDLQLIQQTRSV